MPESKPLKVFLSSPLTNLKEDTRRYVIQLLWLIEKVCKELGFEVFQARKAGNDPLRNPKRKSKEVHYIDRKELLTSDLAIFYCSKPSSGLGDEYALAEQAGIPGVLIAEKGETISRMILGGFVKLIGIIEFEEPEDLEESLKELLNKLKPELLTRRLTLSRFDYRIIGERISKSRASRGMTRDYLAERVGVDKDYISLLETEPDIANPSFKILQAIAYELGVTASYLVDPDIPEDYPIFQENIKSLSEFAWEHNIPYREYQELLISARRLSNEAKRKMRKEEWLSLYQRMKKYRGGKNGQKTLEEFFG